MSVQTRIPKFGSRIPLAGQGPASKVPKLDPLLTPTVTSRDLGKKVRVNDREGTLRFIGHVQFASGTWCGIEVDPGTGKNDGSVHGVRYFGCPQSCGLMAPLSKVIVIPSEPEDSHISGPYSMIFGLENDNNTTFLRSKTFDKIEYSPPKPLGFDETFTKDREDLLSQTMVFKSPNSANHLDSTITNDANNETFCANSNKRNFALENLTNEKFSRRIRCSPPTLLDEDNQGSNSKRDSLEMEESLGILTPNQLADVSGLMGNLTPSSENLALLQMDDNTSSMRESLGIIDLSAVNVHLNRLDETPSPEELPLDPIPIMECKQCKEECKQPQNSIITSITSTTSLDTGYQGDGELSRPESRGADHLSLPRRQQPRQISRRPDPMTDSDFYTESDADNHDEQPLRGDRKAQVIDGTLYGVDAQATADLYANNRENMDSSGIFTDIERTDDVSSSADNNVDVQRRLVELSPSDSSTKTISDDSQSNVNVILSKSSSRNDKSSSNDKSSCHNDRSSSNGKSSLNDKASSNDSKSSNPNEKASMNDNRSSLHENQIPPADDAISNSSTVISNRSSSLRSVSSKGSNNKYKSPSTAKRNVASKVKTMEPNNKENVGERRTQVKKSGLGRWDAVMNKISKSSDTKNFKEVKSKVFTSLGPNVQRNNAENNKQQQQQGVKATPVNRRIRSRVSMTTAGKKSPASVNNSSSDLSSTASPGKYSSGSRNAVPLSEKKLDVFRVGINSQKSAINKGRNNNKNQNGDAGNNKINRRSLFSSMQDKKNNQTSKDTGKSAVKGGRVSPNTRPPLLIISKQQLPPPQPEPPAAEALAVLVQHLVFNLEAFSTPSLKKDLKKARLEVQELQLSYRELEESLHDQKVRHSELIEDERNKYRAEITQLIEKHRNEILQVKETTLSMANAELESEDQKHQEQVQKLREEFEKLQRTLEESVEILREENDATRAEIDDRDEKIKQLQHYKQECERLRRENEDKDLKLSDALQENNRIREDFANGKGDTSMQEVQSLRVVLELKQAEFAEMRKSLAMALQKADQLPAAEERIALLSAKCEDLQHQLGTRKDVETQLIAENKKLNESTKESFNREKRLSQVNEELLWKLQQNKELVSKVLEEAEASAFSRFTNISASFNERHNSSKRQSFERTLSLRERAQSKNVTVRKVRNCDALSDEQGDEISPPTSPKVKAVVEKSDSLSYVLEMDESPEVAASRIVRRSFRNITPPNCTSSKSPVNKRPRKTNPLTVSVSESTIGSNREVMKTRSAQTTRTLEEDEEFFEWPMHVLRASTPNTSKHKGAASCWEAAQSEEVDYDDEIEIPALPSEIGRRDRKPLPVPKHYAGEAMISESYSEEDDESVTGSSSSGQL